MAVTDYSATPGSNTAISGINIAENCTPANINNAIRQLMADIAAGLDDGAFIGGASYQPLDATLTALAALTTAANKLVYATGSDTFATTDLSAFGRTLIDDANAAAARTTLGVFDVSGASLANPGYITFSNGFKVQWAAVRSGLMPPVRLLILRPSPRSGFAWSAAGLFRLLPRGIFMLPPLAGFRARRY